MRTSRRASRCREQRGFSVFPMWAAGDSSVDRQAATVLLQRCWRRWWCRGRIASHVYEDRQLWIAATRLQAMEGTFGIWHLTRVASLSFVSCKRGQHSSISVSEGGTVGKLQKWWLKDGTGMFASWNYNCTVRDLSRSAGVCTFIKWKPRVTVLNKFASDGVEVQLRNGAMQSSARELQLYSGYLFF